MLPLNTNHRTEEVRESLPAVLEQYKATHGVSILSDDQFPGFRDTCNNLGDLNMSPEDLFRFLSCVSFLPRFNFVDSCLVLHLAFTSHQVLLRGADMAESLPNPNRPLPKHPPLPFPKASRFQTLHSQHTTPRPAHSAMPLVGAYQTESALHPIPARPIPTLPAATATAMPTPAVIP